MSADRNTLYDFLPHGPGLRLIGDRRASEHGWLAFSVVFPQKLSARDQSGRIEPELGLEIMAQACGLLLEATSKTPHRSIGVVASVRGYEYTPVELDTNQNFLVRVKPEAIEGGIAICEAALYSDEHRTLLQKARITLAIQEQLT